MLRPNLASATWPVRRSTPHAHYGTGARRGRVGEVATAVALHRFRETCRDGWGAVALSRESAGGDDEWISARIARTIRAGHRRLEAELRLTIDERSLGLDELAYEAAALDGLLSKEDVQVLAPTYTCLPAADRDRTGRWREVLADFTRAKRVEVMAALALMGQSDEELGARADEWFIRLAAAGLGEGLASELENYAAIRLADGARAAPACARASGAVFARSDETDSLAAKLGLQRRISSAYLSRATSARRVRSWLEEEGLLVVRLSPLQTLEALAVHQETEALEVSNDLLVALRDALDGVNEDIRLRLGTGIGRSIRVRGLHWVGKERRPVPVRPAEAYLPSSVEGGRDAWAKAAVRTPGLRWIHPGYADVLRTERDVTRMGARALFMLLGADVAPRLREPEFTERRYGEAAAPIDYSNLSDVQTEAVKALPRYPSHVRGDHLAPDLDEVIADLMAEGQLKQRRERARALLATLERGWKRIYAGHELATAVYSMYSWQKLGRIPATWIARTASARWLSNESGTARAPRELAVRTRALMAVYGDQRRLFAAELDEDAASHLSVQALGVETFPRASRLINVLVDLRQQSDAGHAVESREASRLYTALAELCPKPGTAVKADSMIDELRFASCAGTLALAKLAD